jgi:uncharacterized protein DUF4352
MRNSPLIWALAIALGVVAVAGAYALFSAVQPAQTIGFGQPIRQDDFVYTVVGVARAKSLGAAGDRVLAHGTFYVPTIEVENKAVRVAYRWDPAIVYVVDGAGHRYQVSLDGQRALDATRSQGQMIQAGDTAPFQVAFDLPDGIDHPALGFSNGILMGDVFNGGAYMKARVPLQ